MSLCSCSSISGLTEASLVPKPSCSCSPKTKIQHNKKKWILKDKCKTIIQPHYWAKQEGSSHQRWDRCLQWPLKRSRPERECWCFMIFSCFFPDWVNDFFTVWSSCSGVVFSGFYVCPSGFIVAVWWPDCGVTGCLFVLLVQLAGLRCLILIMLETFVIF